MYAQPPFLRNIISTSRQHVVERVLPVKGTLEQLAASTWHIFHLQIGT